MAAGERCKSQKAGTTGHRWGKEGSKRLVKNEAEGV
jgi:hypothetical protein